jgi:gliding motility-associated lipoprotein GldH
MENGKMALKTGVMTIRIKPFLCLLMLVFGMVSCDKKQVFDAYHDFDAGWHKDSVVQFDLPKMSPTAKHDLFVNIRDNNDYPFQNLFLIVSLERPNREVTVDTLEYEMAYPDGKLMGEGFTDTKDNKLLYKRDMAFPLKGTYKIRIQQAIRQNGNVAGITQLPGITSVGFRIENQD